MRVLPATIVTLSSMHVAAAGIFNPGQQQIGGRQEVGGGGDGGQDEDGGVEVEGLGGRLADGAEAAQDGGQFVVQVGRGGGGIFDLDERHGVLDMSKMRHIMPQRRVDASVIKKPFGS